MNIDFFLYFDPILTLNLGRALNFDIQNLILIFPTDVKVSGLIIYNTVLELFNIMVIHSTL